MNAVSPTVATETPAVTHPVTRASQVDGSAMLKIIADAAANPAVDVTKMQALLDMQERILDRQAKAAFNHALARVSATMPRVKKNGRVDLGAGKGSYDFAKWEDMDTVIRPLMRQEGFTLSFDMEPRDGGGGVVVGKLLHQDGHSETARIPLPADGGAGRNNLQAMGSTLSYGKRYCAEMLLNIVREGADDDAQTGGAEYITAQQAASIQADLAAVGGDQEKFLAMLRAATFQDIRKADHGRAMNMLAAKKRQQGGRP